MAPLTPIDDLRRYLSAASNGKPTDLTIIRAGAVRDALRIIELYGEQIRYLLAELHRVGWTQYPPEPLSEP